MKAFLQLEDVCQRFGGLSVLEGVSLTVPRGGIFGLIGPNGAGKTTAFNLISGLLSPTSGDIRFLGESIVGLPPHEIFRLGLARTFQNIRLFKDMSLIENVKVGMHANLHYGVAGALLRSSTFRESENVATAKAHELLSELRLGDKATQLAGNLSYGEQRKLEIARALASEPKLLLLDEPVAGMNSGEKMELMKEIRNIADRGYTILLIEHDMRFVMELCEQIAVLNFGRIIAQGNAQEIIQNPRVIEAYLGADDDAILEEAE